MAFHPGIYLGLPGAIDILSCFTRPLMPVQNMLMHSSTVNQITYIPNFRFFVQKKTKKKRQQQKMKRTTKANIRITDYPPP
jgi:phosphotransferase system  glucose/maltose/N-acetylglucosamine-specific IIC component